MYTMQWKIFPRQFREKSWFLNIFYLRVKLTKLTTTFIYAKPQLLSKVHLAGNISQSNYKCTCHSNINKILLSLSKHFMDMEKLQQAHSQESSKAEMLLKERTLRAQIIIHWGHKLKTVELIFAKTNIQN